MPTRKYNHNTLRLGDYNAICDRCGFKFKASELKLEWTGLQVCVDDWEPRHPSDFFKGFADDQSVPYSRPDSVETGGVDINGNPFPPVYQFGDGESVEFGDGTPVSL